MRKVRAHILLVLVAVFCTGSAGLEWIRSAPLPAGCTLHHFFHANIFHLAANCLAVWTMFGKGWKESWKEILAAYIIGSLSFLAHPEATVGISNLLFAVLGMRCIRNGWWRTRYFAVLWVTLIATAFIPSISGLTHCLSCAGGMLAGWISTKYKSLSEDYGKAGGGK